MTNTIYPENMYEDNHKKEEPIFDIEETMKDAVKNPDNYSIDQLSELWVKWQDIIAKKKLDEHNLRIKEKMLKDFEKAVDKNYVPNWKTSLWVLQGKIKEKTSNLKEKIKKK